MRAEGWARSQGERWTMSCREEGGLGPGSHQAPSRQGGTCDCTSVSCLPAHGSVGAALAACLPLGIPLSVWHRVRAQ